MRTIHLKRSVVINLPVESIFAYMCNLEHLIDWSSIIFSVKVISPGEMRVGTVAKSGVRFLGRRSEMVFEVVECTPSHFLTIKSISGVAPCILYYRFEALEGGATSIAQDTVISLIGELTNLAEQAVGNALCRHLEHDLLTLKDVLEIYTPPCI